MKITHHNPDTLSENPVFSQAVSVSGAGTMIYVGGQNGLTPEGRMAGSDVASQSAQALRNVLSALGDVGASQEHVLKLTVYLVQGQDINEAFGAAQQIWGVHPTAISVVVVAGLVVPGALVEVEAVAALA